MTHGKALKASDIERIHADLAKHDEAKLAIAKKYSITIETLNKIDWVRRRARKYGPKASLRVSRHQVSQQSDQEKRGD